ncbi:hypothetical protein OE699_15385 [Sedimentimonas flavescens]|uniref:Uncharacterized protein n=1 Tax=Sedimentimonas flavescens TaxID=2851012 RepID=A0ABT3A2S0_9RHOB|nr:hypothetical protein [Sedimentimonas flavescens]MCV2880225.1 hypothetical protein [Sedimentimonas flavescens]
MTKTTKDQLSQLHHAGAPLSGAWLSYARAEDRARWVELKNQSAPEAFAKGVEASQAVEGDILTKLTQAFKGPQAILTARSELAKKLQANILSYIANGQLHGFGYELPRQVASAPVAIPKVAWTGQCDWVNGTLSYQGLQFVGVRLTTNRKRNEILERGHVDLTPPRAVGRPSVAKDILSAIHALHEAGEIDVTASQYSHICKLRGWLELHRPDLDPPPNAISDETFRKQFAPFFKTLKENTKQ